MVKLKVLSSSKKARHRTAMERQEGKALTSNASHTKKPLKDEWVFKKDDRHTPPCPRPRVGSLNQNNKIEINEGVKVMAIRDINIELSGDSTTPDGEEENNSKIELKCCEVVLRKINSDIVEKALEDYKLEIRASAQIELNTDGEQELDFDQVIVESNIEMPDTKVSTPLSQDSTIEVAASMKSIKVSSAVNPDNLSKPFHGWSKEVEPRCGLPWVQQDYSGYDLRSPFQMKPSLTICMVADEGEKWPDSKGSSFKKATDRVFSDSHFEVESSVNISRADIRDKPVCRFFSRLAICSSVSNPNSSQKTSDCRVLESGHVDGGLNKLVTSVASKPTVPDNLTIWKKEDPKDRVKSNLWSTNVIDPTPATLATESKRETPPSVKLQVFNPMSGDMKDRVIQSSMRSRGGVKTRGGTRPRMQMGRRVIGMQGQRPSDICGGNLKPEDIHGASLRPSGAGGANLRPPSIRETPLRPSGAGVQHLRPSGVRGVHHGPSGVSGTHSGPSGVRGVHHGSSGVRGAHPGPSGVRGAHPVPSGVRGAHLGPSPVCGAHPGPSTFRVAHPGPSAVQLEHPGSSNVRGAHLGPTVRGAHLGPSTVRGAHPGPSAVSVAHPGPSTVRGVDLGPSTVRGADLGPSGVCGAHLGPSAVRGAHLRPSGVCGVPPRPPGIRGAPPMPPSMPGAPYRQQLPRDKGRVWVPASKIPRVPEGPIYVPVDPAKLPPAPQPKIIKVETIDISDEDPLPTDTDFVLDRLKTCGISWTRNRTPTKPKSLELPPGISVSPSTISRSVRNWVSHEDVDDGGFCSNTPVSQDPAEMPNEHT